MWLTVIVVTCCDADIAFSVTSDFWIKILPSCEYSLGFVDVDPPSVRFRVENGSMVSVLSESLLFNPSADALNPLEWPIALRQVRLWIFYMLCSSCNRFNNVFERLPT